MFPLLDSSFRGQGAPRDLTDESKEILLQLHSIWPPKNEIWIFFLSARTRITFWKVFFSKPRLFDVKLNIECNKLQFAEESQRRKRYKTVNKNWLQNTSCISSHCNPEDPPPGYSNQCFHNNYILHIYVWNQSFICEKAGFEGNILTSNSSLSWRRNNKL